MPSVALSRVGHARKKKLTDIGKGGPRDAWQVLANGGVATFCAVAAAAQSTQSGSVRASAAEVADRPWIAAFAGAYAAATADTWGTEIGTLARGKPRSILTLKPIATGLSGGVTLAGSAAEVVGALWMGACVIAALHSVPDEPASGSNQPASEPSQPAAPVRVAPLITPRNTRSRGPFDAIVLGGIAGALIDSLLGATLQELRRCPTCERTCETNPHACRTPTVLVRGIPGFSNDIVNFAATLSGALTAFILTSFSSQRRDAKQEH